jgi:ribosomal protein L32
MAAPPAPEREQAYFADYALKPLLAMSSCETAGPAFRAHRICRHIVDAGRSKFECIVPAERESRP